MKKISIMIPCYNEEEVLPETVKRLNEKLVSLIEAGVISEDSRMLFVNDGSKDSTWNIINHFCEENPLVLGVNLSRNKGHQNALIAGLSVAKEYADMVISMDADLQDDINAIDKFVEKYYEGCEVVYGVRSQRETDTAFKRKTAEAFYKFMLYLGVDVVYNHADYRLMSKRALYALENYKEVNLFLRGIVPLIGFKSDIVEYERSERFAGESKYPLIKMINFATDGITSFSVKPIRFITFGGLGIFVLSVLVLLIGGIVKLFGANVLPFYPLGCLISLMGSLQLIAIGIVGEYVGKNYMETKERPRFFIDTVNLINLPGQDTDE